MKIYQHKSLLQKIILSTVFVILFNFIMPNVMVVSMAALTENYEELPSRAISGDNFDDIMSQFGINKKFKDFDFDFQNPQTFSEVTADGKQRITFSIKRENLGYGNYKKYVVSITKKEDITSSNQKQASDINGTGATGAENFNKKLQENGISTKVEDMKFTKVDGKNNELDAIVQDADGNNYRVVKKINTQTGAESYSISAYDGDPNEVDGDAMNNGKSEDGDDADLGGILLSPFVAFVNFIADAVAAGTQKFMLGDKDIWPNTVSSWNDVKDDIETSGTADVTIKEDLGTVGTYYPNFKYSPEEIFANKVPMLNVNFLNPNAEFSTDQDKYNIALQLQKIIRAWYRVLRMMAIVGLLSVLIYIGIRIMIDSNAGNKAKYKEKLIDWVVALVILFTMHYIMSFALTMTQELTNLFTGDNNETQNIIVNYTKDKKVFKTNLMGLARFQVQNDGFLKKVSYEIVYIALLAFTVKFTITYLIRVVNMAFLTLISPAVAMMYPLQDGKSQAFGMWLKEYIFNLLLQPLHYLLYTVLISSAISLAANNPLYAIVALLFMSQAEKFLKTLFGFDKAKGTMMNGMSAFAAGTLVSNLASGFKKGAGFLTGNVGNKNNQQPEYTKNRLPRMKKDTGIESLSQGENVEIGGTTQKQQPKNVKGTTPMPIIGGNVENGENQNNSIIPPQENNPLNVLNNKPNLGDSGVNNMLKNPQSMKLADMIESRKREPEDINKNRKEGVKRILKNVARPFWDTDKSTKSNLKRWGRRYVQAGMGVATAVAEFGISATDGKFNPLETVVSATAGGTAAGKAFDVFSEGTGIADTYRAGAYGDDQAALISYQRDWNEDANINRQYKEQYKEKYKEYKDTAMQEFLPRGIANFEDQKQAFKYMDAIEDEKYNQWESNEKQVIKNENKDFNEEQVQAEFDKRKAQQAAEIREKLGKQGKGLSDDKAIRTAVADRKELAKEAATVVQFRKQAEKKGALIGSNREAFENQQTKALVNRGMSEQDARKVVNNAFDKLDKFDSVNNM